VVTGKTSALLTRSAPLAVDRLFPNTVSYSWLDRRVARIAWGVAIGILALALAAAQARAEPRSRVALNGVPTPVFFNDGDSFTVLSGPLQGTKARLSGYNTLESFGPVHRWGTWDAHELYIVAKMATLNARRGAWHCESDLKRDGYGRILWHCPDLAEDQIRKGLAHAMTVSTDASPPAYVKAQRLAMAEKRGMWAHGIPNFVLTSLHSMDEGYEGENYNRLISTQDGHSEKWLHKDVYRECQEVCHEGGACMVYVAFDKRYGAHRAACLH